MRVTGGFLADLDINFAPGLNVIIGARGAGKTTLLELLRHALGAQHADVSRRERQRQFVRTLLGDGEVVVDLEGETQSHRLVVDAAGGGQRPEFSTAALVLAQNELEGIANSATSRLALIDMRADVTKPPTPAIEAQELTTELAHLRARLLDLREQLKQRPLLAQDHEALQQQEAQLLGRASQDLTVQREELRRLEDELLATQRRRRWALDGAEGTGELIRVAAALGGGLTRLNAQPLPLDADAKASLEAVLRDVQDFGGRLASIAQALQASEVSAAGRELQLRNEAEPVRASLETAERGMGELTARLQRLQAQMAELDGLQAEADERVAMYASIREQRNALLDDVETTGEARYEARLHVAESVSIALEERVTVSIEHLADAAPLRDYLHRRLHGSNLKYTALADAISRTVLPRQLLEQVELGQAASLATTANIPIERAARVIDYLQEPAALGELADVSLEDRVDFLLRDGATTKRVDELSTGQKCAVTLPILMTEHARAVVLDQPEDHLDNAYLVANVVRGLIRRSLEGAQTIVASHNANIPVLGSAERVIALASDGRRGYVDHSGAFDSPVVVDAITTLMEGGRDAFARRAAFYAGHGPSR